MGIYEVAKDALTLAQKADNIELVKKLMDVQSSALDMQQKLQEKNEEVFSLKQQIKLIEDQKKYVYDKPHKWLIKTDNPDIKLCPTCLNRNDFESPLGDANLYETGYRYCGNCKSTVN